MTKHISLQTAILTTLLMIGLAAIIIGAQITNARISNPGSSSSGSQSPWTTDIAGAGHSLTNVGAITATTITATSSATSTISNLGGVLDPSLFPGVELGARSNAAYLNAPNYGTSLNIPAPTSTSQWSYTTPILIGTNGKPARITCAFAGGAPNYGTNGIGLLYTPTTGSAIKFDTGQGSNESGSASGLVNCGLFGTNGTTARTSVGVEFGGATNGAFTGYLNGVNLSGMGTGVKFSGNTSFNFIQNSTINFNGRNISEPDTGGANCENLRLLGSIIADANNQAGGVTDLKGMYVQESGNCQWNNIANSFDDNQIYQDQFGGTANVWTWAANHFENPNLHVYPMVETIPTAFQVINSFIGGDMMNDVIAGQPDQIKAVGMVNLIGFTSDANSNVTTPVTRIVNALASSTVITWDGLACKGANATSFVYGNVPCSPFGVGSDYGQPSLFVGSSTASRIGGVGIGTSSPFAKLSVHLGSANDNWPAAFTIASTTAAGGIVNLFSINSRGGIQMIDPILATSTSMTVDWGNGSTQTVRVGTAATAISFTGQTPGASLALEICNSQSAAGAVTFSGVLWPGGTPPTTTTTANKCDLVTLRAGNGTSTPIIYGGWNSNY